MPLRVRAHKGAFLTRAEKRPCFLLCKCFWLLPDVPAEHFCVSVRSSHGLPPKRGGISMSRWRTCCASTHVLHSPQRPRVQSTARASSSSSEHSAAATRAASTTLRHHSERGTMAQAQELWCSVELTAESSRRPSSLLRGYLVVVLASKT